MITSVRGYLKREEFWLLLLDRQDKYQLSFTGNSVRDEVWDHYLKFRSAIRLTGTLREVAGRKFLRVIRVEWGTR